MCEVGGGMGGQSWEVAIYGLPLTAAYPPQSVPPPPQGSAACSLQPAMLHPEP